MIETKTTWLLSCALLIGGVAAAGGGDEAQDGYGEKKGAYGEKAKAAWTLDPDKAVALFDEALASCCAQATCAEEGGCMTPCSDCESGTCTEKHAHPVEMLVKALSATPEVFGMLQPRIEERFLVTEGGEAERAFLLAALTWCEGEDVVACGETLFAARPDAFEASHVLAFASQGSEPFGADLARRARAGEVLPAAFLAVKGKNEELSNACRKTLHEVATAEEVCPGSLAEQLTAARTLATLGKEKVFLKAQLRAADAVMAALDAGKLEEARRMALVSEYFAGKGAIVKPQGLSRLGYELEAHCAGRSKEVATADAIFELIERITPVM